MKMFKGRSTLTTIIWIAFITLIVSACMGKASFRHVILFPIYLIGGCFEYFLVLIFLVLIVALILYLIFK